MNRHFRALGARPALAMLCLSLLFACNRNPATQGDASGHDSLDMATADEMARVVNTFPSPIQLMGLLKAAGAQYDAEALNPSNKADQYTTTAAKALNMGVYSAGMAYANLFGQRQDAARYLSAVDKLANDLGLDGIFTPAMRQRAQRYENNQDSLVALYSELLADLKTRLHENQQGPVLNLMFAGGFVEGLHLALATHAAKPTQAIAEQIAEQKFNYARLVEYLVPMKSEPGVAELLARLEGLRAPFDAVKIEYTGPGQAAQSSNGGVITIQNRNHITITPETIQALRAALGPVRRHIVQ